MELCRDPALLLHPNPLRARCLLVVWKSSSYTTYERSDRSIFILEPSSSDGARWPFYIMSAARLECSVCVLCVVHPWHASCLLSHFMVCLDCPIEAFYQSYRVHDGEFSLGIVKRPLPTF